MERIIIGHFCDIPPNISDSKLFDQLILKLEKVESALSKVPDFPSVKQVTISCSCL